MESTGMEDRIQISGNTYALLPPAEADLWECRGAVEVKVSPLLAIGCHARLTERPLEAHVVHKIRKEGLGCTVPWQGS
jgi:hypothetical protein